MHLKITFFVLHSLKNRLPSNTQVLYRLVQPDNEHSEGGLIGFTLGTVTVADSKLLLTILFSAARTHRHTQSQPANIYPSHTPDFSCTVTTHTHSHTPGEFQRRDASSRSVRAAAPVLLGEGQILHACPAIQNLHTLTLHKLLHLANVTCLKQQLDRTLQNLRGT